MLNFFKPADRKKADRAKINTYTTLADFYIENGFQKEARSTLEDLARYYDGIGYTAEAKKLLLLAGEVGAGKRPASIERYLLHDNEQPGVQQRLAQPCEPGTTLSAERSEEFFDLESALTEQDSPAVPDLPVYQRPPLVAPRVNALPGTHAAIFREIKLSAKKNTGENNHNFHYALGMAHRQLHRLDGAIEEFTAALTEVKNSSAQDAAAGATAGDCYLQLVTCYDTMNKPAKAAQYALKALQLDSLTAEQKLFFEGYVARCEHPAGVKWLYLFLAKQLMQVKQILLWLCTISIT